MRSLTLHILAGLTLAAAVGFGQQTQTSLPRGGDSLVEHRTMKDRVNLLMEDQANLLVEDRVNLLMDWMTGETEDQQQVALVLDQLQVTSVLETSNKSPRSWKPATSCLGPGNQQQVASVLGKQQQVALVLGERAPKHARTGSAPAGSDSAESGVQFTFVDVYVDSGSQPLAAWQVELTAEAEGGEGKAEKDDVKIVGIEGGEHAAYREPAYYDPAALMHHRVILATFNTGNDLPTGKTRVARVHLQVPAGAEPQFKLNLETAAGSDGQRIEASATVNRGDQP